MNYFGVVMDLLAVTALMITFITSSVSCFQVLLNPDCEPVNKEMLKNMNRFHRKQKRGFIDVWWLFDDGGLTLLLPYLLSTRSAWKSSKLRIFMAGTKSKELDRDQRQ